MQSLLIYGLILSVIYLADGIMAYSVTVLIEQAFNNSLLMGLTLSTSSMIGIICDALFPNFFRKKTFYFFISATVLISLFFPLVFLFFNHQFATFLLGMLLWGIYFEFLLFSNYYFVDKFSNKKNRSLFWGVISISRSLGLLISPVIASYFINHSNKIALVIALILYLVAILFVMFFKQKFTSNDEVEVHNNQFFEEKLSIKKQIKIWFILLKKIYPIYFFTFILYLLESTYYTVGILLSEELVEITILGSLFLVVYILPNIFSGFMVAFFNKNLGKKKTAFISGISGGIILFFTFFLDLTAESPEFLIMIFVASFFTSLALPSINSAIQDYVNRLDENGADLIGLQNTASSLAYIIGPTLAGFTSLFLGNKNTFVVMGVVLVSVSLACLFLLPHKVRLPQKEIENI